MRATQGVDNLNEELASRLLLTTLSNMGYSIKGNPGMSMTLLPGIDYLTTSRIFSKDEITAYNQTTDPDLDVSHQYAISYRFMYTLADEDPPQGVDELTIFADATLWYEGELNTLTKYTGLYDRAYFHHLIWEKKRDVTETLLPE